MSRFATGTLNTTNGAPTGGLGYTGGEVFAAEGAVIAPEAPHEITIDVVISAPEGDIVQLPTGLPAGNGDTVTLTLPQYEELSRAVVGSLVTVDAVNDTPVDVGATPFTDGTGDDAGTIGEFPESETTIESAFAS